MIMMSGRSKMKNKNARSLIAIFLFVLVLLPGCSVFTAEVEEAPGNILNGGFITEDGGWLYFNRMEGDTIYLYRERTSGSRGAKISTDAGAPISMANEWLYFSKFGIDDADTEAGVLFKMKPDGSDRVMVSEEKAYNVVVEGEYAYYLGIYGTMAKLIRIHLETKEKTVLTEDSLFGFILHEEWIYYVNLSDTLGNLYRMKLDGSGKEKLNDDNTGQFTIDDGFIYFVLDETPYSDGADGVLSDEGLMPVFMMHKMKYDGSDRSKVAEVSNGSMNVHKGWIYYQDSIDGMVYRVKIDGTGKIRIRDNSLTNIIIIGDWIYFYDNQQPDSPSVYRSILGSMYRMKLDGSKEELFE